MSPELFKKASSAAAGTSLLSLYLPFISMFISNPNLYPNRGVETAVFGSMVLRLLLVLSVPKFRIAPSEAVFIIFSLENLLLPPLALFYIITNNITFIHLIREIFFAWPSASAVLLPPYAIWRFAKSLYREVRLSNLLPSATLQWAYLAFITGLAFEDMSGTGLNSLTRLMLSSFWSEKASVSSFPYLSTGPLVFAIIFYLALLTRIILSYQEGPQLELYLAFLFPLLATGLAILWVTITMMYGMEVFLSLTAPTLIVSLILWWYTRGQ